MDNYQNGMDSIAYLIGAYFTASDNVPDADWDRDNRQAYLNGGDPGDGVVNFGVRSAVRV